MLRYQTIYTYIQTKMIGCTTGAGQPLQGAFAVPGADTQVAASRIAARAYAAPRAATEGPPVLRCKRRTKPGMVGSWDQKVAS